MFFFLTSLFVVVLYIFGVINIMCIKGRPGFVFAYWRRSTMTEIKAFHLFPFKFFLEKKRLNLGR